jgi:arylsulfatase B
LLQGFDLHDGFKSVWEGQGKYATELFTEKSIEVIEKHAVEEPLFLVVSHLAPHTGKNGNELEVPDATVTDAKYHYIEEPLRRNYAGKKLNKYFVVRVLIEN